jgi:membrane-associated protease RseP (regulator of RpoE activity)
VNPPLPEDPRSTIPIHIDWRAVPPGDFHYTSVPRRSPRKMLIIACVLFLLTLCTCLAAGTQFAISYANNQAASLDEFVRAFKLFYQHPAGLAAGLPFAITLLAILLAHELGHFFACRHHHIRASYPFFIPFPSLIGTFGAFILIRSPIRTARALFDVGASGPFAGFILAIPALAYGVLHAKLVPTLADTAQADFVFGIPLLLRLFAALLHPGVTPGTLLIHPIGRAAWVGLFATSLNLLPAAQLDGGHILRSISARLHRYMSVLLPLGLILLGFLNFWQGWYIWGCLLLAIRFLRAAPIYDSTPLDPTRRWAALCAFIIFLLCFMPAPFYFS